VCVCVCVCVIALRWSGGHCRLQRYQEVCYSSVKCILVLHMRMTQRRNRQKNLTFAGTNFRSVMVTLRIFAAENVKKIHRRVVGKNSVRTRNANETRHRNA